MDLISCTPPAVALDSAPVSALRSERSNERWDGFWGEDDAYYVRLTRLDAESVEWFRLADTLHDDVTISSLNGRPGVSRRSSAVGGMRALIVRDSRGRPRLSCMVWVRRRKTA